MVQRSVVSLLATLGGILVILGGVFGFLFSLGPGLFGPRFDGAASSLVLGIVAVILGLIILFYSGFTHIQGMSRGITGGVILIVLGAVTWVVVGQWILVAIGSFLVALAGLVLILEAFLADPHFRTATSP
jgi:hypothetical protein